MVGRFEWFTEWVHQHLGLTLTFGAARSWQDMAVCFGAVPRVVARATFLEAGQMPGAHLRVGTIGTWTYGVEALSERGADPTVLARLSGERREAFALCYTPDISTFSYAADGRSVVGFDMTLPAQRYGEEPERFADALERAGFLIGDIPRPSMGAAFIEDVFGITLEPELLERPMPTVALD